MKRLIPGATRQPLSAISGNRSRSRQFFRTDYWLLCARLVAVLAILLFRATAFSATGAPPRAVTSFPAERFAKPDPEKAFASLKIYDTSESPLRVPLEDWGRARARATADGAWKTWIRGQRKDVDEWMSSQKDRPEWIAGWWHDFVSPRDGSFLTWTPDEPREKLSSPSDKEVMVTPKLHAAWVFGFRGRHAGKMEDAAMLYRVTGDAKYAAWTASQLDFYATNYLGWPLQTSKGRSRIMHQSLDEAVNLIRYVNAARLLGDFPSAERKQMWIERLFKPEAALLDETFQFVHNIACWQRSAQAHVALYAKDSAIWARAVDGPFGIRRQVADGVTSDYLWLEQSLLYNNYVVSSLLPFFRAVAREGRLSELRHEAAVIQNLMLAPTMLRFPNGLLPTPADSTGGRASAPSTNAFASAYGIFPTAIGLEAAANHRSWNTLLDPPVAPATRPPLPEVASLNLESTRMAVLRQGGWQVFFHYGQIDASHAQAEALHYEAFFGDTDISHDAGTVGYGSPLHREYYTRALAHNVPLMSGEGQERWNPGELLRFDAASAAVSAAQRNYRRDVFASRELRIEGARLVDTTRIQARTNLNRRAGLALHLQGKVELPMDFSPNTTFTNARPAAFRHWSQPRTAQYRDSASFIVNYGRQRMRVTLSTPGAFAVTHAVAPDMPPKRRDAFYVEVPGSQATFTTTIEPVR
jgi:oligo-alginate lyase